MENGMSAEEATSHNVGKSTPQEMDESHNEQMKFSSAERDAMLVSQDRTKDNSKVKGQVNTLSDVMEISGKGTWQLDLALPCDLLQECLQWTVGQRANATANTDDGSKLEVQLRKDQPKQIRMLFPGILKPAAEAMSDIWKCHIFSVEFDDQNTRIPRIPSATRTLRNPRKKTKGKAQINHRSKGRVRWKLRHRTKTVRSPKGNCLVPVKDEIESAVDEEWDGQLELEETDDVNIACQACGREFAKQSHLHNHVEDHRVSFAEYQDLIDEGEIGVFSRKVLLEIFQTMPFQGDSQCNLCGQNIKDLASLQKHLHRHGLTVAEYNYMLKHNTLRDFITDGVVPGEEELCTNERAEYPEECQVCQSAFRTKLSLWNHIRRHDLDSYRYQSLVEEGKLDEFLKNRKVNAANKKTKKQYNVHKNKVVPCPVCGKSFSRLEELRSHLCEVHPEENAKAELVDEAQKIRKNAHLLKCPACELKLKSSNILRHIKTEHASDSDYPSLHEKCCKMLEAKGSSLGSAPKKCPLCGKEVRQRFLRAHIIKFCSRNPDKISLLKCRRCGYNTMDPKKLEEHQQRHDPSQVFMCHVCGKSYQHSSGLTRHERGAHKIFKRIPLKPFVCQQCGKSYLLKNQFQLHLVTHTDDANIQCHVCGKMFKRRKAVQHHIKTQHLNIFPYQCQKCGYGMERRSTFESHKCDRTKPRRAKQANKKTNLPASFSNRPGGGPSDGVTVDDQDLFGGNPQVNCDLGSTSSQIPLGLFSTQHALPHVQVPQIDSIMQNNIGPCVAPSMFGQTVPVSGHLPFGPL